MDCKKRLPEPEQLYVDQARAIARDLVQHESRGPGDTDNAMRRLEARYGVPYGFLWSLRYRPPKDVLMGAWHRLTAAYRAECERVERRAAAERERIEALDAALASMGNAAGAEAKALAAGAAAAPPEAG